MDRAGQAGGTTRDSVKEQPSNPLVNCSESPTLGALILDQVPIMITQT